MTHLEIEEGVLEILEAMAAVFGLEGPADVLNMVTSDWRSQFVGEPRIP